MAPPVQLKLGDALVIVDLQIDFLPGGALAVPQAGEVVPVLNGYLDIFEIQRLPVYATRDWHPPDHCSFRTQGGPWPVHCVAGSAGAGFAPALKLPRRTVVISKGTQPDREAYSGFQGTDLERRLRMVGIQRLFIGGVATDYCVRQTVEDAWKRRFQIFLLRDAIRAVNTQPDDGARAEADMLRWGVLPITQADLAH
jgi:nicotinamidase/pyrazinamidase